jgi:ubiquinone/menaquinone biosynthesis C-methylase UbiE
MKINSEEIKSNIKKHYSVGGKDWRTNFKDVKGTTFISKLINFLKRSQFDAIKKYIETLQSANFAMHKQSNIQTILDAGCGNGEYSLFLAKKFPNATIYAIDFSQKMCELTKRRAKKQELNNIIVQEGDVENLIFANNYFDLVLCIDLLHHIPNITLSKSLTQLQRVSKTNASIIIDFKNKHNPILYYQHKKRNRITYYRTNRTIKEMQRFLDLTKMKIIKSIGAGGPKLFAPYVTLFCKKIS